MPFQKGRQKTGGKRSGTLNKLTQAKLEEIDHLCNRLQYNPIEAMVRIACNRRAPIELRAKMHAEVAPYLYSKKASLDGMPAGSTFQVILMRAGQELAPAQSAPQLAAPPVVVLDRS